MSTSIYHDWYVEEIQRLHTTDDEILYRVTLNNSNLLDGDHYDNYLEHQNLYISDAGVLMPPPVDLNPLVCRGCTRQIER